MGIYVTGSGERTTVDYHAIRTAPRHKVLGRVRFTILGVSKERVVELPLCVKAPCLLLLLGEVV